MVASHLTKGNPQQSISMEILAKNGIKQFSRPHDIKD